MNFGSLLRRNNFKNRYEKYCKFKNIIITECDKVINLHMAHMLVRSSTTTDSIYLTINMEDKIKGVDIYNDNFTDYMGMVTSEYLEPYYGFKITGVYLSYRGRGRDPKIKMRISWEIV